MSYRRKPKITSVAEVIRLRERGKSNPQAAILSMVLVFVLGAASAAKTVLHGHVMKTNHTAQPVTASRKPSGPGVSSELVDKYGAAANSSKVAGEIERAVSQTAPSASAPSKSEQIEALMQGRYLPGTAPDLALSYKVIPPGMPPQEVAMRMRGLPNVPRMPHPMTSFDLSRMAREPLDPLSGMPGAMTPKRLRAQNQQFAEEAIHERMGPGYVPPLQVDHAWLAQHAQRTPTGWVSQNHQGSITEMTDASGNIIWQGRYDPYGTATTLQGTTPPDSMYRGMYHHARSDLYLTPHRVYSPDLGRWLTRDPIQDPTFRLTPRVKEPVPPEKLALAQMLRSTPKKYRKHTMELLRARDRVAFSDNNNTYSYAANDPINLSDPSGLMIGLPHPNPGPKHCPSNGPGDGCHPPHPGDPGTEGWDVFDCYEWCAQHCTSLADYDDCTVECDEWYL